MALALVAFSSGSSHPRNLSSARVFSARSRATATLKTSPAWRSTSKSSLLPIFSYRALAFHGKVLLVLLIWQFAPRFDLSLSECAKISRFFLGSIETRDEDDLLRILKARTRREREIRNDRFTCRDARNPTESFCETSFDDTRG